MKYQETHSNKRPILEWEY